MTKSELVAQLTAGNPHLLASDVERIVGTILAGITDALARGDRVELRGFGSFETRHRTARKGRNPRTGEAVTVPEKAAVHFRAGKELRQRVDRGAPTARQAADAPRQARGC